MNLLYYALKLFEAILVVRIILSWIRPDPANQAVQIVYAITEPVLAPIRRLLPIHGFGFDFSPLLVFIVIEMIIRFVL